MFEQKTLSGAIEFEGRGLHTGKPVKMKLLPAPPDHGVVFSRVDLASHTLPARYEYLSGTRLSTTLSRNGIQVGTIEHLLASLAGLGIDNLRIELDGPEVPILDGSALPFVEGIFETGLLRQDAPRSFLTILKPVSVSEGDKRLVIFPSNDLRITYAIDFPHPSIGYQERDFHMSGRVFTEEIAPARTFCLYKDVEVMRRQGLALGGDLSNAVVVGDDGILTGSLRYRDEFVRHKMLDLLGDLALLGHPVRGHLVAFKGGHGLHAALVQKLSQSPDAWRLTAGRTALPGNWIRSFDPQKARVLPGHALTA
jgi:UDP-3-O-[3-hydroxymyristoyl] N-acetylglucosamine deacetylase